LQDFRFWIILGQWTVEDNFLQYVIIPIVPIVPIGVTIDPGQPFMLLGLGQHIFVQWLHIKYLSCCLGFFRKIDYVIVFQSW